jgi:hypothetical protein
MTLVAGTTWNGASITFNSTTTGRTITTNGIAFNLGSFTFDGAGGGWTLGSALNTVTAGIFITRGTFNTGNYNVTGGGLASSNSNTRTITLGSSTVTGVGNQVVNFGTTTNLTFNANTSTINGSNGGTTFIGGGLTYNNVGFTSSSTGTRTISGANTFANLTLTTSATGLSQLALAANQTITGTFTCAGTSVGQRGYVRSDTRGTARTLTVATLAATDCDFRDITLAGAASPASPTRAGNCGNNTNITFPAAKTVYRVGTNTTWAGSNSWATSSNGTGADANFPLVQDTAVIDEGTALTGTLSIGNYNMGAFNASTRTTGITINHNASADRYGNYTLGSGVTISGTSTQTFVNTNTVDITSAGKTLTFPITFDGPAGTLRLLDALTMSSGVAFQHNNGTLNLNGYTLTVGTSYTTGTGTKNLTFNGGTLVCPNSSTTAFNNAAPTGFTTTAGTGTGIISMTSGSAKTFVGGGSTYNCTLNNGGAGALTITGSNTFTTLANSVQPTSFLFTAGTTTTLTNWNINGTVGNFVTIGSVTAASHTLSKASGTVTGNYLSISRSNATGGATWNATNSTDGGNNTGWIITAPPPPVISPSNFFLLLGGW